MKKIKLLGLIAPLLVLTSCSIMGTRTVVVEPTNSSVALGRSEIHFAGIYDQSTTVEQDGVEKELSYIGFDPDGDLITVEDEGEKKEVGLMNYSDQQLRLFDGDYSCILNALPFNGQMLIESNGDMKTDLSLIDLKNGVEKQIDNYDLASKVTDATWSDNGKFFSYILLDHDGYTIKLYDCDNQVLNSYNTEDFVPSGWQWGLKQITPISVFLVQGRYIAMQVFYDSDCYLIVGELPESEEDVVRMDDIYVEKCESSPGAVSSRDGVIYYIDDNQKLVSYAPSEGVLRDISGNVSGFTLSDDGKVIAYTIKNSNSSEWIYVKKTADYDKQGNLISIRPNIEKMNFNADGSKLLVEYRGNSSSDEQNYLVIELV